MRTFIAAALTLMSLGGIVLARPGQMQTDPMSTVRVGQGQKVALKHGNGIFQAVGFGNSFLVATSEGNVVIDTSMPFNAQLHKKLLQAEDAGPIRYIILTHAHGDHTGGVSAWKQPGTEIIAQQNHAEFQHYMARLNGFYGRRNAAQFALPMPASAPRWPGNYGATIEPTILFGDKHEFQLGGVTFVVMRTPGETPDHLTVWIPQYKAAFIGDNYYDSFPNIYTLRGTQPRWALDYVSSLNAVLALNPEIVLPSHGTPIRGNAEITAKLTRYRDAIQYVHDETVKGMNAGTDVWTLMNRIRLPAALDIGESYGKLSWSIRGIYEGYVGWFDLNPATMYETPAASVYADVVTLAGGPDAVTKLALARLQQGKPVDALHLVDLALAANATHAGALEAKLKALETLAGQSRNSNERGWLDYSIAEIKKQITNR